MNFVGRQLDLPCRHGRATPPRVAGEHRKRCRTCRTTFVLIVEPTEHLEPKLGTEVLHARWANTEADAA